MIKLFVCDVDNTLLTHQAGIPQENIDAILTLQKNGIIVALASGRIIPGMIDLAKLLQLKTYGGYLVASNGATVISLKDEKVLLDERISLDKLKEITETAKHLGIYTHVQQGNTLYYTQENEALRYNRDVVGLHVKKQEDMTSTLFESAPKVEITSWFQSDKKPFDEFVKRYEHEYTMIRGHRNFIDLTPLNVTKATGVGVIMKELGLKASEVAAIGDGENDRHMLKAAGLSATLANADVSLQSEVDHVVASVEQAGLSHFAHLVLAKNTT